MARRPIVPKPVRVYRYDSIEQCEQAEETGGLHRAEVKTWPPARSRAGEANPSVSTRCSHCGGHLLVYGDNNPEASGIEVIVPEATPKSPAKALSK